MRVYTSVTSLWRRDNAFMFRSWSRLSIIIGTRRVTTLGNSLFRRLRDVRRSRKHLLIVTQWLLAVWGVVCAYLAHYHAGKEWFSRTL